MDVEYVDGEYVRVRGRSTTSHVVRKYVDGGRSKYVDGARSKYVVRGRSTGVRGREYVDGVQLAT